MTGRPMPDRSEPSQADTMTVEVQLFAVARELAGRDRVRLKLPVGSTAADVRRGLGAAVPELGSLVDHMLLAVGGEYAESHATVPEGADVACIPPVSGG